MRTYGRVSAAFWTDEKTVGLSSNGKVLALYILTGPHSNGIGCYRLPVAYIADDLKWEFGTVSETLSELLASGFVKRCETTSWLFIPKFLIHNTPENPNVGIALSKLIALVPTKCSFYQEFIASLLPHAKRFPEGFVERLPKGMPNKEPSPSPSPEPSPEPSPSLAKASKVAEPPGDDPALGGGGALLWAGSDACQPDAWARMLDELNGLVGTGLLSPFASELTSSLTSRSVRGAILTAAQQAKLVQVYEEHRKHINDVGRRARKRRWPDYEAVMLTAHGQALMAALSSRSEAAVDRVIRAWADEQRSAA